MKNLFKNIWVKLFIILIIIAAIVVCVIIFWPKKTSKNVIDITNDITNSNYVVSSKVFQEDIIDYVKNTTFENSHKIEEVYLQNVVDNFNLYNSLLENINTLSNYVLLLDKNVDKEYLNNAYKALKSIKKEIKSNYEDLENTYNLVINYNNNDDILYQVATNKLKNFINSINNQILFLNKVQSIIFEGSKALINNNALYSTVIFNKVNYLNGIASKINEGLDYSVYQESVSYYKSIYINYFNQEFDYKIYYETEELKNFVNLSNEIELLEFYKNFKTDNFDSYINRLADVNKKIYLDFSSALESLYQDINGDKE